MLPKFIAVLRKKAGIVDSKREFPNASDGEAVIISYNFMSQVPEKPQTDVLVDPSEIFEKYTALEKQVVLRALNAWASVANIKFVKSTSQNADLMFGKHKMPYKVNGYAGGLTYDYASQTTHGADVWLNSNNFLNTKLGQQVATHEIGHALGLTHPFVGKNGLSASQYKTSIMSHSLWGEDPYQGAPARLGVIDAAAIQSIYGPAKKKLAANSYQVGKTKLIWDGGGIDTISASSAKAKAYIDMNDGSWSWIGKKSSSILAKNQSWLGHYTNIEKAFGSKYADIIVGNELDNTIKGGEGNDKLIGGRGGDLLVGGAGQDVFVFKQITDIGSPERPDVIQSIEQSDKIDLRNLGLTFRGNAHGDSALDVYKPGQFYFNVSQQQLRFDANGDGIVDHAIEVIGFSATHNLLL